MSRNVCTRVAHHSSCLLVATGLLLSSSAAFAAVTPEPGSASGPIRLVLQITVDGLRGDLLQRYRASFGEQGFNTLLRNGVVYRDAHYQHANTETIVGHATLASGAHPAQHGMIGNVWYDRGKGELAYNIEDPASPLLPAREVQIDGAQVDPAQKQSRTQGRSPRAMLAPTLGDTLSAYYAGQAKVFGIGGKDRSAVAMAGKTGKAFWYSTDSGDFVTSRYYYDSYPGWVSDWNGQRAAESHGGQAWTLRDPAGSYLAAARDDRPYEVDLKGYGRVFPHPYGEPGDPLFATRLLVSPVGDQLTADFARTLIAQEGLGKDDIPDYLSISFSGVDAVNHFFGPSSLENEDVVRQLDRTLTDLLAAVDQQVGLDHTLLVLSADHGMADMPEYLTELGYEVGRLDPNALVEAANRAGQTFGIDQVVKQFFRPYVYLDEEAIAAAGADRQAVTRAVADALTAIDGVELALPTAGLSQQLGTPLVEAVRNNQHHSRSGDIYVAQSPYWFLFDEGPIAAMHGSPWRYDTHVPIIIAGPGIPARQIDRRVHPVDVAPTIAALLGLSPPAASQGRVLFEALAEPPVVAPATP